MPAEPIATIVITTKNRKDELERAVRSCVTLSGAVEVLVVDDGSDDGTSDMITRLFPGVRLERKDQSGGYIAARNLGARLARAPIIFSIDDDAEFSTPDIVLQILAAFGDSRVAAVAIPFTEPNKTGDTLFQTAPDGTPGWCTNFFIGTAHAVRRDVFLALGAYDENLIHQGEETDYCIRLLDAGHRIALGVSDPIIHYESPKRDKRRMDYYGARNNLLFVWQNVPFPNILVVLPATTLKTLLFALEWPRFTLRAGAIADAFAMFGKVKRTPVSRSTFTMFRRMKTHGPERGGPERE